MDGQDYVLSAQDRARLSALLGAFDSGELTAKGPRRAAPLLPGLVFFLGRAVADGSASTVYGSPTYGGGLRRIEAANPGVAVRYWVINSAGLPEESDLDIAYDWLGTGCKSDDKLYLFRHQQSGTLYYLVSPTSAAWPSGGGGGTKTYGVIYSATGSIDSGSTKIPFESAGSNCVNCSGDTTNYEIDFDTSGMFQINFMASGIPAWSGGGSPTTDCQGTAELTINGVAGGEASTTISFMDEAKTHLKAVNFGFTYQAQLTAGDAVGVKWSWAACDSTLASVTLFTQLTAHNID